MEMDTSRHNAIRREATNVMMRIVAFIAYYILLIICGLALIAGAVFVSYFLVVVVASITFRFWFYLLVALFLMWGVVGMFAVYLIKPLFAFHSDHSDNRVEITKDDAPLLFECIAALAGATGCKMPKHVYLTTDVNACVSYDTCFWSIFFPVRKNLTIGLGLFQNTNVEELRSIIGHEFGHFSQRSMKVGSSVYLVNSILYNMVYGDDFYERWLWGLSHSDNKWIVTLGHLSHSMTNIVRRMNAGVYKFVQRPYMSLSRQMEYDADSISAHVVGKEAFVSALCKIEVLAQFQNLYEQFLQHLGLQHKTIRHYWEGYATVRQLTAADYCYTFDCGTTLTAPLTMEKVKSLVSIDNQWASHPETEQRIAQALKCEVHSSENHESALSLLPAELADHVALLRLGELTQAADGQQSVVIGAGDFKAWVENEINTYFIPLNLRPFFNRAPLYFKGPTEEELAQPIDNPFTEKNAAVLSEFEMGVQDTHLLMALANHQVDTTLFTYRGKTFDTSHVPLDTHKAYTDKLYKEAMQIDKDVFIYLYQHCDNKDRLSYAYDCLFFAGYMLNHMDSFTARRDQIIYSWNQYSRDIEEYGTLIDLTKELLTYFKRFLREKTNWPLLHSIVNENTFKEMYAFAEDKAMELYGDDGNTEKVSNALGMIDIFENTFRYMDRLGTQVVVEEAKRVVLEKSDKGKE